MDDARKQHLELVAASLTQAYYKEHTAPNRDYREFTFNGSSAGRAAGPPPRP